MSGLNLGYSGYNYSTLNYQNYNTGMDQNQYDNSQCDPSDPVTQAVYDNAMGKLPLKRPKVLSTCDTCQLNFNSTEQLEAHVQGGKHARKVKALQDPTGAAEPPTPIITTTPAPITTTTITTSVSGGTTGTKIFLSCKVCDVTVNSAAQLDAHNAGSKHKNKLQLLSGEKKPKTDDGTTNGMAEGDGGAKAKKPLVNKEKLTCIPCNIQVNSEQQLQQHLASKKHLDRLAGRPTKSKPKFWFNKASNLGTSSTSTYEPAPFSLLSTPMPSLSDSFVKKDLVYF